MSRRLHSYLGTMGLAALAAAGAIAATGCSGSGADEACVSDEMYFAEQAWSKVLGTQCIGCHNAQGAAKDTSFVLKGSSEAGFLSANQDVFGAVASLEQNGESLALLKPTEQVTHGGKKLFDVDSEQYNILAEMVRRYKEPSACETDTTAFFQGVQNASASGTLRMAALELLGRLPTEAEEKAVEEGGMDALDTILDQWMGTGAAPGEEAFYTRVKEIYGDLFHTDRYLNGESVNLIATDDYDPEWYNALAYDASLIERYGAESWPDLMDTLRGETVTAVAREPLELIAYVVRNDRPFTEILTANYMVVNPFSAKAYGVYGVEFTNEADPNEWHEAYREGMPHSGVLSSPMWLSRFPTTPTNLNRHRSRMVYQFFLGTDVLKLAERRLDTSATTDFNPTMNNANCAVCHAVVDPIAGWFQKFDDQGRYDAEAVWPETLRPPGFLGDAVPYAEFPTANQWGVKRLVDDPRFALAAVYNVMQGLTGQKPMTPPAQGEENFEVKFRAYLAQYYMFNEFAQDFVKGNYDIRRVFKAIIKSPYFRARNYGGEVNADRELELSQLASTRFLPPEQLHRKIWAVTGYPWREDRFFGDFLLSQQRYKLLYGGLDHEDVLQRISEPNGIMANVADRMANEMACTAVPRDFSLATEERLLFPFVDKTLEPMDANGYEIPQAIDAIKQNIQYLHKRVLGESLDISDPEIQRTYQLFLETWQEGRAGMALPEGDPARLSSQLPGACHVWDDFWTYEALPEGQEVVGDENYSIRAWMAVITYMLSDFRFLYQ